MSGNDHELIWLCVQTSYTQKQQTTHSVDDGWKLEQLTLCRMTHEPSKHKISPATSKTNSEFEQVKTYIELTCPENNTISIESLTLLAN